MRRSEAELTVCPLASGSKGNAYWIEAAGTSILVDLGISLRQLVQRTEKIGRHPRQIDHVFITHEHTDHTRGLAVFLKRHHPVIWGSRGTMRRLRGVIPDGSRVRIVDGKVETAGAFRVRAVPIDHDATEPIAYRFESSAGSAAIVTDLGHWTDLICEATMGVDVLVCEANHDPGMLRNGPYHPLVKLRIASNLGHLSNRDGAKLALEAVRNGTSHVILGHLSEQNNSPDLALREFLHHFAPLARQPKIEVASQNHPGPCVIIKHKK